MLKVVEPINMSEVERNKPELIRNPEYLASALNHYGLSDNGLEHICSFSDIDKRSITSEASGLWVLNFRDFNHYKFLEAISSALISQLPSVTYGGVSLETWRYLTLLKLKEEDL